MKTAFTCLALFALLVLMVGCNAERTPSDTGSGEVSSDEPIVMDEMPPIIDDDRDHPEHGPHGGELIELGKEAFHAEFVHAEQGIVLYMLDGSARNQVAIESTQLVISLKKEGEVASFVLDASSDEADPDGQASRFVSSDSKLDEWLDGGAEGAVVVQIEGKSYTGKIVHDHDHAGHQH